MQKNGKTKETIMTTTGTFIAAVIGCHVLVLESYRNYVLLAVTGIWLAVLWYKLRKIHSEQKEQKKEHTMQIIDLEPDYKNLFSQQLQLRVQEKLCTKFPGAVVELCEKEVERLATLGRAVYVPVRKADGFCHIGISLKGNGELQMNLFSLVDLDTVHTANSFVQEVPEQDVGQWFTQKGQQLLMELITNMNSRGYTELSISENGDVTVKENGRSVLKDHFQEIPAKKNWAQLKELMASEDVQVKVSGRKLTLAW